MGIKSHRWSDKGQVFTFLKLSFFFIDRKAREIICLVASVRPFVSLSIYGFGLPSAKENHGDTCMEYSPRSLCVCQ